MLSLHRFFFLMLIFSYILQNSGLMSDYKTCGDQACARMMSRVQALKDHPAPDCRFLNFKKGDMIEVYHKLTSNRKPFWAGSLDKQFGYFLRDAVRIDAVFVDESKEIKMPTQKTDFLCTDAFGSVFESDHEFQDEDFEELGKSEISDWHLKSLEQNDFIEKKHISQNGAQDHSEKDQSEQSRSSWIGSTVSGWFGEATHKNEGEETFRSRKLALDIKENQLRQKINNEPLVSTKDEGSGFEKKDLENEHVIENNGDSTKAQSKFWLSNGIQSALGLGGQVEEPVQEERVQNHGESTSDETISGAWYGSVYNRITSLYKDTSDGDAIKAESVIKAGNEEIEPTVSNQEPQVDKTKQNQDSFTECRNEHCVESIEDTRTSETDVDQTNKTDDFSQITDSEDIVDASSEPEVETDENFLLEEILNGNTIEPDRRIEQLDAIIHNKDFEQPEKLKNDFGADFASDAVKYVINGSNDLKHIVCQVMMSLPDNMRPGPDLYGIPWEVVIISAVLGLITVLLFTCRFFKSMKSRLYASRERRMGQKVAELLEEKCKVLETLSECKHKYEKLNAAEQNGDLAAQASEMKDLEALSKELEKSNEQMRRNMEQLQEQLEQQNQLRIQQSQQLEQLEEMLKTQDKEAKDCKSQLEQDKTTLKIYDMNSERLQKKLQESQEENVMLLESKAQLVKESEGWMERLSELEEERRMSERSHNRMMENCTSKDERIKSLTECLLKMRDWNSEEDGAVDYDGTTQITNSDLAQKQKVQKLIYAAKMSADLKAMEDDKNRLFAKFADEIKAKEDLQEGIQQMQQEQESLQSDSSMYTTEIQKLQHKLQIMTEMFQENELKLHRMLTVEEKERSQKEEQLNKAGKKISLAAEELNSYRQRSKELEEELEKTNQAYKNQISAHEKKAHDNWLAARAADRDLADVKRENSVLRQRFTDWQFKLELMEKDPYARDAPARLIRGERSPYGPSPLGQPPSETRPFLSPPTLMDGPPRVSPQFPMMHGGRVPPGGVVEGDRSLSHSDGGSPTWERERERERERRAFVPPGPDAGVMYRRPPSAPFLRAPPPPDSYYSDKADSSLGGNSTGAELNESRNSVHSVPGDMRPPPELDMRMGPLPPFPPVDPRDPHFPRRVFRPDFPFPPMGLRGPLPPPGVFPSIPIPPHMAFPPMRLPADHVSPEPPSRPSPPGSEQPPQQPPAHDAI